MHSEDGSEFTRIDAEHFRERPPGCLKEDRVKRAVILKEAPNAFTMDRGAKMTGGGDLQDFFGDLFEPTNAPGALPDIFRNDEDAKALIANEPLWDEIRREVMSAVNTGSFTSSNQSLQRYIDTLRRLLDGLNEFMEGVDSVERDGDRVVLSRNDGEQIFVDCSDWRAFKSADPENWLTPKGGALGEGTYWFNNGLKIHGNLQDENSKLEVFGHVQLTKWQLYQLLVDEEYRIDLPDQRYQQTQSPVCLYVLCVDPMKISRDDSHPNHVRIYGSWVFNHDTKVDRGLYVDLRTGEITRELPPSATLD